ncbi:MAG: DUF1295 domain-containing protein [Acidimicrobiaceae bacterium]|nr:DUF1295 domain-containing protein [Acidimicrobiaceae bacterium]MCY4175539.1 DUF1295 domain-containing protein [Acidimicrobiaceae bacterium]MCY4280115.1 DUF1295 domain-containing protein [Acidimicrobiaceae bacterium]MCY4293892.1 DUF1295 domain-containing protein [Acidimicrobiaceae bacterium]
MPDVPPVLAPSGAVLLEAAAMLAVFVGALFVGSMLVPGRRITGPDLGGGKTITYKLNGLALLLLTALAAGVAQAFDVFSLSSLYTHFFALLIVTNVFAVAFSVWLCRRGARKQAEKPSFLQSCLVTSELNPSLAGVDLKMFSYRPSLIGLAMLNTSFAVVQYETYDELTLAMVLYQIFTWIYVINYFQFEGGMVHTWDIIHERFGWMLVWGDYVLVPFFYCIAGWWLVDAGAPELNPFAAGAIVLLYVLGFWMFRGANNQKHRFKRDPSATIWGRPAEALDGRLLVSGFWGIGRHLNYSGEICIYIAFALTTGFTSFVPFLLPAWLAGLLWNRSRRDERRCSAKYGELWVRYKQRVPYAMLPFVY